MEEGRTLFFGEEMAFSDDVKASRPKEVDGIEEDV